MSTSTRGKGYGEGATLWMLQPSSSRSAVTDYLVYAGRGGPAAGHFSPEWEILKQP